MCLLHWPHDGIVQLDVVFGRGEEKAREDHAHFLGPQCTLPAEQITPTIISAATQPYQARHRQHFVYHDDHTEKRRETGILKPKLAEGGNFLLEQKNVGFLLSGEGFEGRQGGGCWQVKPETGRVQELVVVQQAVARATEGTEGAEARQVTLVVLTGRQHDWLEDRLETVALVF